MKCLWWRSNGANPSDTESSCGKKFTHDRTDANYALYQKQRNKCTSSTQKAIKAYFLNKSETEKPNEFWNTYRPFLQSRKSRQTNDILLERRGTYQRQNWESEYFQQLFYSHCWCSSRNKRGGLWNWSQYSSKHSAVHINQHSSNVKTNFDFELTNSKQVEMFLLEMNTRKSCGHDLIPPRLLKDSACVISETLAKINELFNQSRSLSFTLEFGASDPIILEGRRIL